MSKESILGERTNFGFEPIDSEVRMGIKIGSPLATSSISLDHTDNWLFSITTDMTRVIEGQ